MENQKLEMLSISKAAKIMRIGKDKLYELIKQSKIGFVEIGERKKIPYLEIERFIAENLKYCTTSTSITIWSNQSNISTNNSTIETSSVEIFNKMKGKL